MKKKSKSKNYKYFINRKIKRAKNNSKDIINRKSSNEIKSENKTPIKNNIANDLIFREKLPIIHNELLPEKDINYFIEFKTNPKNIKFEKTLINDVSHEQESYSQNVFIIFKSFNEIYYIIYINESSSIVSYDLFNNIKVCEIKNKLPETISIINHYPDYNSKRDLIMTVQEMHRNLKIWNFSDFSLIYEFKKIYTKGSLHAGCFLNEDQHIYILTGNHRFNGKKAAPIKVYDLNGNKIKDIKDSNDNSFFISIYYDDNLNKKFILAGFPEYVKAYDYKKNMVYRTYKDIYNGFNRNVIINKSEDIIKLIQSSSDGYIRIWDFHKAELILELEICPIRESKIPYSCDGGLYGICLWNNDYLFVGTSEEMKLINIKIGKIISNIKYKKYKDFDSNYESLISIKKIKHPKFGECLISKTLCSTNIQIWSNKE